MHTDKHPDENRDEADVKAVGTRVGIRYKGTEYLGIIHSRDPGGWIYINWDRQPNDADGPKLPWFCRDGNVYEVQE